LALTMSMTMLVSLSIPREAQAIPSGPVLLGGWVLAPERTELSNGETVDMGPLSGPTFQVGYEIGDRFNNQFSFQFSRASGPAAVEGQSVTANVAIQTLGGGYQLTLDILRKEGYHGFTPYLGGGFFLGVGDVEVHASSGGFSAVATGSAIFLELHAVAGVRYTLPMGLGFRAEVLYSTYGGFFGTWMPQIGVAYRL
jgi:hypothetical protein